MQFCPSVCGAEGLTQEPVHPAQPTYRPKKQGKLMDMTFLESCFLNLASRCKVQNFSKAFKSNFESRARCKLCVSWAPGF